LYTDAADGTVTVPSTHMTAGTTALAGSASTWPPHDCSWLTVMPAGARVRACVRGVG
jgi:hypothetical protein